MRHVTYHSLFLREILFFSHFYFVGCSASFLPGKGSVGGDEAGEKAKMTLDAVGKSVSEKSQATPGLQEPLLEIKK
jgi:hypothetical protein